MLDTSACTHRTDTLHVAVHKTQPCCKNLSAVCTLTPCVTQHAQAQQVHFSLLLEQTNLASNKTKKYNRTPGPVQNKDLTQRT